MPAYSSVYLYLTHACGANCSFCYRKGFYERNKVWDGGMGPITMTKEVARDAVEFCLNELPLKDDFHFYFWGGEPFLNFKTMKYVMETYSQFEYSTNTEGKPVTKEIADFIKAFGHYTITWSFGNAYEKFGSLKGKVEAQPHIADVIKTRPLRTGVNLVLQNYENIESDFLYLTENVTKNVTVDFATRQYNSDEELAKFEEGYYKLLKKYMKMDSVHAGKNPAFDSNLWFEKFGPKDKIKPWRFCRTGLDRLFIDTSGGIWQCDNFYICQHNKLGSIYEGIDYSKLDWVWEIEENINEKMSQHCDGCEAYGNCPRNKCLGYDLEWTGDIYKPDESFCVMCRAIYRVVKRIINETN
jgi:uncharacterized protein